MWNALPLLGDAPFIAVNGDIWTDFDFARLPRAPDGDAHLVLVDNPPQHPQGDFAFARTWRARHRPMPPRPRQAVRSCLRLRADGMRRLTFAGIGVYRPSLFDGWRAIIGDVPGADDDASAVHARAVAARRDGARRSHRRASPRAVDRRRHPRSAAERWTRDSPGPDRSALGTGTSALDSPPGDRGITFGQRGSAPAFNGFASTSTARLSRGRVLRVVAGLSPTIGVKNNEKARVCLILACSPPALAPSRGARRLHGAQHRAGHHQRAGAVLPCEGLQREHDDGQPRSSSPATGFRWIARPCASKQRELGQRFLECDLR